MSILRVRHVTTFGYSGPVGASYNEARMKPVTLPGQLVLESRIDVRPHTWLHEYRDYWGTAVTAFEVLAPHTALVITAESTVEVTEVPAATSGCTWETLTAPDLTDRMAEYLAETPTTAVPEQVVRLAAEVSAGLPPDEAAVAICAALREEMEYVPGVTSAHTPAAEAWAARTGVCQDMAHLAAGALRSVGIPARYVSGYLYPRRGGEIGESVEGESHAWLEWWAGDWCGYDPTNRIAAGENHVILARGREYGDVAPLKGVFAGEGSESLAVQVTIVRES